MAENPGNPSNIYLGEYDAASTPGIYRSTNGGQSFAQVRSVYDSDRISLAIGPPASGAPLACSGGTSSCGIVYAMFGSGNGAYEAFVASTDGGMTWSQGTVPFLRGQNGIVMDGTGKIGRIRLSMEKYDQALAVSPLDPATVFFGGIGLYESTDAGRTWTFLAKKGGTDAEQHALAVAADNDTVYLGNDGGAFKFSISGISNGTAAFTSDADNPQLTVNTSGTGVPGSLKISPTALSFGSVKVGSVSSARNVKLNNPNPPPIAINNVSASAGFTVVGNSCGAMLAAKAGCVISVAFSPTTPGKDNGMLSIEDNAAGNPHRVASQEPADRRTRRFAAHHDSLRAPA